MRDDALPEDEGVDDAGDSSTRTGPRHAAPRRSLLNRASAPAGKAIAMAAMPTAVLMGMGLTPKLASADELPKNPFSGDKCVSQPDSPSPSSSPSASPSGSPSASPSNSPSPSASSKAATPTPAPSASKSAAPKSSTTQSSSGQSGSSGGLLGGLGGTLTGLGNTLTGGGSSTSKAAPTPTPSPSASSNTGGNGGNPVGAVTKTVGKTVGNVAGSVTGAAKSVTGSVTKTVSSAVPNVVPSASSGQAYPCPTYNAKALADAGNEQTPELLPNQPWVLKTSLLTLNGLDYHGIVKVKTADGSVKPVLKFTASTVDIKDLHQIVDGPNGTFEHVKAAPGSTSTIRNGTVTMYTQELKGNLFGLIPVTFSPDSPPPVNVPFAFFTNVTVVQAGQFGGTLHVPGMDAYGDNSSD